MEAYMVSLDRFYGPLDLLLYLVEKNEMDIYDISITRITGQYLDYIHQAENLAVENITDFLQMATFLLQLKSRMLLPKTPMMPEEAEEIDPQEMLVGRIVLYKKFKMMAELLDSRQRDVIEQAFSRPIAVLPEVPPDAFRGEKESLKRAWQQMQQRQHTRRLFTLPFQEIRVEKRIQEIWDCLHQAAGELSFQSLTTAEAGRRDIAVSFLAVLELLYQQKITVVQSGLFAEIRLRIIAPEE